MTAGSSSVTQPVSTAFTCECRRRECAGQLSEAPRRPKAVRRRLTRCCVETYLGLVYTPFGVLTAVPFGPLTTFPFLLRPLSDGWV